MSEGNYWTSFPLHKPLSRRRLLASGGAAGAGLAAIAVAGCGDDDEDQQSQATGTTGVTAQIKRGGVLRFAATNYPTSYNPQFSTGSRVSTPSALFALSTGPGVPFL